MIPVPTQERDFLLKCYHRLLDHFGPQYWWPGESTFEIIVGAVLTQNTAWSNVEKSISQLKQSGLLSLESLLNTPANVIKEKIKSSGYYNLKYDRLINLLKKLKEDGAFQFFQQAELNKAREELLKIKGIGKETADSILLYAFQRPIFVVDAYTRRLFGRLRYPEFQKAEYDHIRTFFQLHLPEDTTLFNEYHALIVRQAKIVCNRRPQCNSCVLNDLCETFLKNR